MQERQMSLDKELHDSQQQARAQREESLIARTKCYGQAV